MELVRNMNLLKKCPICNNRFTFREIVVGRAKEMKTNKKNKFSLYCRKCNSYLRVKQPIYRYLYMFVVLYPTVLLTGQLYISNTVLDMFALFTTLNVLFILFDVIEHRFNRYIIDEKKSANE